MLASFSEFKFYQSFRVPVQEVDDIRFLVEQRDQGTRDSEYIEDAKLVDISMTGLGFATKKRLSVGQFLDISIQFKKVHLDLSVKVVRAFSNTREDDSIIYGVEFDEEDDVKKFIQTYINSFNSERLKDCLIHAALRERYASASEGFEMFSLLISLVRDITNFGQQENFIETLLDEVARIFNAQSVLLYLINPQTNELEAISALGVDDKDKLKFDYRQGIAGSVFTTGTSLNIDMETDKSRIDNFFEKVTGIKPKSVVCNPVYNREDKVIGVLQIVNKRNEMRFSNEDERTMKVMSMIFSSLYHDYNPMTEKSLIRRFSAPYDREYALIGVSPEMNRIRRTIVKLKDIDYPLYIHGESGVGKTLFAKVLHNEGQRGLHHFELFDCIDSTDEEFELKLMALDPNVNVYTKCHDGTLFFQNIHKLDIEKQKRLVSRLHDIEQSKNEETNNIRFIASSSHDLTELVSKGEINRELSEFFSHTYVHLEPLRKRTQDIGSLVNYFLKMECRKQGLLLKSFSEKALKMLERYEWPGNVSELKTCVERAVIYHPKAHVIHDIKNNVIPLFNQNKSALKMFSDIPFASDHTISLKDRIILVERRMIDTEISRHGGNKSKAASEMGISREALRKKLQQSDKVIAKLDEYQDKEAA